MGRRIHLIAPAGSCKPFFATVGIRDTDDLIERVRRAVGGGCEISGNRELIEVDEDENHGGRRDDDARARDIQDALADSSVAAVIALRGGAWFARIMPRIDYSVLDARTSRVAVFGFSELTSLVNVVAAHRNGMGIYDMGPAFLVYGMKRYAAQRIAAGDPEFANIGPTDWMLAHWGGEFERYFHRVVRIIEDREKIELDARLARGTLAAPQTAQFVGGNLTVLSTLIGSPYDSCLCGDDRWLVLEDFNDKLERIDRFLSHLTLAGVWETIAGLLLGDFHHGERDLLPAVLEMLEFHISDLRDLPILTCATIGHVWPMTPLPLSHRCRIERRGADHFRLEFECFSRNEPAFRRNSN